MTPLGWLALLLAAGVGAPARVLLDRWVQRRFDRPVPWGTFAVNLLGCLALGVVVGLGTGGKLDDTVVDVVGSGGLGALTTFSTFAVEVVALREVRDAAALRYASATLVVGLLAAAGGLWASGIAGA